MSGMGKKDKSGCEKRKARQKKEEYISKLVSVKKYFVVSAEHDQHAPSSTPAASESSLNTEMLEKIDATTNDCATDLDHRDLNNPSTNYSCDESSRGYDQESSVKHNENCLIPSADINKDPKFWPLNLYENEEMRFKYLQKGFSYFQNKDSTFVTSKRKYRTQNRYFNPKLFSKKLPNGEKAERKWLMFSEASGAVFCFVCKLFSKNLKNPFVKDGFSNWKKDQKIVSAHENSKDHSDCMVKCLSYFSKSSSMTRIDKSMIESMESQVQYWRNVLKRVVSVVKFLCERGLSFRGSNEIIGSPNNGNFLGIIELIAKFDPFLDEHIRLYANKGRGNVSYLSKTIYEEFIEAMANEVTKVIVEEIRTAKYWGLVLDSTPDITHVDQLSVVFRYVLNDRVYERFFSFLQIKSHVGRSMSDNVLNLLIEKGIDIQNCRAQTYDNAANMSGKYKGLQACIKKKCDSAIYVPCTAHSLNLVGECSVKECSTAQNFFSLLQQLFVFFTASNYRWEILKTQKASIKSLSITRWSRRSDACNALCNNFDGILTALNTLGSDKEQKPEVQLEASTLSSNIIKIENCYMAVLWNTILNRFESTSQYLQKVDVDLLTASRMLDSLVVFVQNLREKFNEFEAKAKQLGDIEKSDYADTSKRKIIKRLADGSTQSSTLFGPDKFRIKSFYPIIDRLVSELKHRSEAYAYITKLFGFLQRLLTISDTELAEKCIELVKTYSNDLNENLLNEVRQFIPLLREQPREKFMDVETSKIQEKNLNLLKVLEWMIQFDAQQVFPNLYIALRLLLTIPIANCETERSFSVLKRIKNMYRSTMLDDRLSSLTIMSIEKEILQSLNFDGIIDNFARAKARKKYF